MQLTACTDSELADLAAADYSTPQSLTDLPLVERWILSALHQVRCCPVVIVRQHKVILVLGKERHSYIQWRDLGAFWSTDRSCYELRRFWIG